MTDDSYFDPDPDVVAALDDDVVAAAHPETLTDAWKLPLTPDAEVVRGTYRSSGHRYHLLAVADNAPVCRHALKKSDNRVVRTVAVLSPHYTQCRECARVYRNSDYIATTTEIADASLDRDAPDDRTVGGYPVTESVPRYDAEWLRHQYHTRGLTAADITDLDGVECTDSTLNRWLHRHNIEVRDASQYPQTND